MRRLLANVAPVYQLRYIISYVFISQFHNQSRRLQARPKKCMWCAWDPLLYNKELLGHLGADFVMSMVMGKNSEPRINRMRKPCLKSKKGSPGHSLWPIFIMFTYFVDNAKELKNKTTYQCQKLPPGATKALACSLTCSNMTHLGHHQVTESIWLPFGSGTFRG